MASAITTFNSIGLYWKPGGGSSSNTCSVKYRTSGDSWKNGYPLWYAPDGQYRGSIVNLTPNTTYEIQLTLGDGTSTTLTAKTWSENFPIDPNKIHYLSANSSSTLTVSDSGTPNGYALYTPEPGKTVTIDVANNQNYNVSVNASYVIIRGLILKNAASSGIRINPPSHDIVIEKNDISGWGKILADGWGTDDGAIYAYESGLGPGTINRLIIQRNKMHHPRSDSNNWAEVRTATGQSNPYHPTGPQALLWWAIGSNHVIRYNEIYSDANHYYNDCIGGQYNYSTYGFPNADSDIYGNIISHCWDDAIEADGGNRNVRIWGNYLNAGVSKISCATNSVGPLYIWRNISGIAQKSPSDYEGSFIKTGGWANYPDNNVRGEGRIYVFHNTLLQPLSSGSKIGSSPAIGNGPTLNMYTRNNIFYTKSNTVTSNSTGSSNSFDNDLHNGTSIGGPSGSESHGILGAPVYNPNNNANEYFLAPSTLGYNAGIPIPNFNDDSAGAPDMGAYEAGKPPLQFGVNAYLITSSSPTPSSCPLAFLGDFNCDGFINESDLNALLISLLTGGKDITGDGKVNESDLNKLLENWKIL